MFCPKCGSILVPKKDANKKWLSCSCGYKSNDMEQAKIKETVQKPEKEVEVVDPKDFKAMPLLDAHCEKCGNGKAFFWTLQREQGMSLKPNSFAARSASTRGAIIINSSSH